MLMRLATIFALLAGFTVTARSAEPLAVRVLYAGNLKDRRADDFQLFLKANFTQVTMTDLRSFREAEAKDHDVVIFDWSMTYDGKGSPDDSKPRPKIPQLSNDFARPSIMIARTAGSMSKSLKLKINWL